MNKIIEGTISHGTLRSQDLLRSFATELARVSTEDDAALIAEAHELAQNDPESESATETVSDLIDRLTDIASEYGFYFGTHPGDGSDFGYWTPED